MASDRLVLAEDVLRTLMKLRRMGSTHLMEDLEKQEKDLCEYLIEELSGIHQQITELGSSIKQSRGIQKRIEALVLVAVLSLREAQLRLWQDQADGTGLAELDPALARERPADRLPHSLDDKQRPSNLS